MPLCARFLSAQIVHRHGLRYGMQLTSTALAVAGIAVSALFGVLAAVPSKPSGWVIGTAIVLSAGATIWLLIVSSPRVYDWYKRRQLRDQLDLRKLSKLEQEKPPSDITDGQYGFDVIYSVHGLKELDPDRNKWARVKRARGTATYVEHYPLEVHRRNGATYVVGFVNASHKRLVNSGASGTITLWMRPLRRANISIEVPLDRIEWEGSRGDGTWRNPWYLELVLTRSAPIAP
jgi:hypothetical protein